MKGAARATREPRSIEENASVFHQPRDGDTCGPSPCNPSTTPLLRELPLVVSQCLCSRLHAGDVLVTGHVRTVRTAPLRQFRCWRGQYALAAVAINAFPV